MIQELIQRHPDPGAFCLASLLNYCLKVKWNVASSMGLSSPLCLGLKITWMLLSLCWAQEPNCRRWLCFSFKQWDLGQGRFPSQGTLAPMQQGSCTAPQRTVRPSHSRELQQSLLDKAIPLGGSRKVENRNENSPWEMPSAFKSSDDVQLACFMVRRGFFMRGSGIWFPRAAGTTVPWVSY